MDEPREATTPVMYEHGREEARFEHDNRDGGKHLRAHDAESRDRVGAGSRMPSTSFVRLR